jgi:hypothetical protein
MATCDDEAPFESPEEVVMVACVLMPSCLGNEALSTIGRSQTSKLEEFVDLRFKSFAFEGVSGRPPPQQAESTSPAAAGRTYCRNGSDDDENI